MPGKNFSIKGLSSFSRKIPCLHEGNMDTEAYAVLSTCQGCEAVNARGSCAQANPSNMSCEHACKLVHSKYIKHEHTKWKRTWICPFANSAKQQHAFLMVTWTPPASNTSS
eukprot:scaffold251095_cov21-Tisochrysis_lutea.AAC.1